MFILVQSISAFAAPAIKLTDAIDGDDLFRVTLGTPGSCSCEAPTCGGAQMFHGDSRAFHGGSGCTDYYNIGGGITAQQDGEICHTFRADYKSCAVYPGSVNGNCSRLVNASCVMSGTATTIVANVDRTCDTLPWRDCNNATSRCCGSNVCALVNPGVSQERMCQPIKLSEQQSNHVADAVSSKSSASTDHRRRRGTTALESNNALDSRVAAHNHSPRLSPWPLWPSHSVPGERPGQIGPEAKSYPFPDDEHLTNVTWPTLTPHLLRGEEQHARSVMIVAPGGGYELLAWDKEGTDVAMWLNSIGLSALILKYRVPDRSWLSFGEAPLMDAQRAMGVARQAAAIHPELGLNASSVGFIGFSAGGHLSAHLATTCSTAPHRRSYTRVDAADDLSCRPDFSLLIYPWRLQEDAKRLNVSASHPPAFLAHAEDDPTAPVLSASLPYYTRLVKAKAPPSEIHIYPRGGHGYGRCTIGASKEMAGEEVCSWDERAARFLNTTRHGGTVRGEAKYISDSQ